MPNAGPLRDGDREAVNRGNHVGHLGAGGVVHVHVGEAHSAGVVGHQHGGEWDVAGVVGVGAGNVEPEVGMRGTRIGARLGEDAEVARQEVAAI